MALDASSTPTSLSEKGGGSSDLEDRPSVRSRRMGGWIEWLNNALRTRALVSMLEIETLG